MFKSRSTIKLEITSIIIFIIFSILSSQSYPSEFFNEVKEDSLSPFTTDAFKVVEVGGGLTLITFLFKNSLENRIRKDIATDQSLRNYSSWGNKLGGYAIPNLAYIALMEGDYLLTQDSLSRERSILMIKASLYSGTMTEILKRSFQETRPNGGTLSFPSGHTNIAFAFSSIVSMEHSLGWGIFANTLAAFIGISRINDNAHYIHDVIGGATIGAMYGVGVYHAQKNRAEKQSSPMTFLLLPLKDGLSATCSFTY